jgi:hypothetical protein
MGASRCLAGVTMEAGGRDMTNLWRVMTLAVLLVACGDDNESSGEFECSGTECVCPGSGDCDIHCLGECDLQCAGSGDCFFECPDGCLAACTGSGACLVSVGDQSAVACPGSGGCDVDCLGSCSVACPGSGVCTVLCLGDASCTLEQCSGEVISCPDGLAVCNGECP